MSVQKLREQIDRIDLRLLEIISRRASLVLKVGQMKRRQGRPVMDRKREKELLKRLTGKNPGPLSALAIRAIFREILRQSRKLQTPDSE